MGNLVFDDEFLDTAPKALFIKVYMKALRKRVGVKFSFFKFIYLFIYYSSKVVSIFSPTFPPQSSPPPTLNPTHLWFCPCVFYTCSMNEGNFIQEKLLKIKVCGI